MASKQFDYSEQYLLYRAPGAPAQPPVRAHADDSENTIPKIQNHEVVGTIAYMKNQASQKAIGSLNAHRWELYEDLNNQLTAARNSNIAIKSQLSGEVLKAMSNNDGSLLLKIGIIQKIENVIGGRSGFDETDESGKSAPFMWVTVFAMGSARSGLENLHKVKVWLRDLLGGRTENEGAVTGLFPGAMVGIIGEVVKKNEDFVVTEVDAHRILLPSMPMLPWNLDQKVKAALGMKSNGQEVPKPVGGAKFTNQQQVSAPPSLRVETVQGPFPIGVLPGIMRGLVDTAVKRSVDALIILGPLLNPMSSVGLGAGDSIVPEQAFNDFYSKFVEDLEGALGEAKSKRLKVVIVPSTEDMVMSPVMPQGPLRQTSENESIIMATNPGAITLGGVRIAFTTEDIPGYMTDSFYEKPRVKELTKHRPHRILSTAARNNCIAPILLGVSMYSKVDYTYYNSTRFTLNVNPAKLMQEGDEVPNGAASANNGEPFNVCPHIVVCSGGTSNRPWAGLLDAATPDDQKGVLAVSTATWAGLMNSTIKVDRKSTAGAGCTPIPITEIHIVDVDKLLFEGFASGASGVTVGSLLLEQHD